MTEHLYTAFGFSTTHKVLEAEDILVSHSIPVKTIPRPVSLGGAECGVALRVKSEDTPATEELFERFAIIPAAYGEITDFGE